MTFFGTAYVLALALWLTQGEGRPWLGFAAIFGVTVFLCVWKIERRQAQRKR